jgi:hypothetical protein
VRLLWYRLTHWLRSSPAVRPVLVTTLGLALALLGSQTEWPSDADREETLTALGSIAAAALFLLATSLTRILGQIAFATGVYSPRLAARLVSRPIVALSMGIFGATVVCAGVSALIIMFGDEGEVGVLPLALSVGFLGASFLAFVGVSVEMTRTYRVSNVVGTTARDGLRQIDRLYLRGEAARRRSPPQAADGRTGPDRACGRRNFRRPPRLLRALARAARQGASSHDPHRARRRRLRRARHAALPTSSARSASASEPSSRESGSAGREPSSRTRSLPSDCWSTWPTGPSRRQSTIRTPPSRPSTASPSS